MTLTGAGDADIDLTLEGATLAELRTIRDTFASFADAPPDLDTWAEHLPIGLWMATAYERGDPIGGNVMFHTDAPPAGWSVCGEAPTELLFFVSLSAFDAPGSLYAGNDAVATVVAEPLELSEDWLDGRWSGRLADGSTACAFPAEATLSVTWSFDKGKGVNEARPCPEYAWP